MESRNYKVTLKGNSPLLMHNMNQEWIDAMKIWRDAPENKKKGRAGDDRTPAWTWLGCTYHDGNVIGLPSDNLMTCIRDGASLVTAKGKKTFKAQSQSGLIINEIQWPITVEGKGVPWAPFEALLENPDFEQHKTTAQETGFVLFVKPAAVNGSKHVRVRPRFDKWEASGTLTVFDDMISKSILQTIFDSAGIYCGIGDWRPKSPTAPGQFGRFFAEIKEVK